MGSVLHIVDKLPQLIDGLLLNCRFGDCVDFEYTPELGLFDYLGLRLFHVWVDRDIAVVAPSWNALTERLVICCELRDQVDGGRRPKPEEESMLAAGVWLEQWLEETRTQSTPQGLRRLMETVRERELCILFRNNHFSTIFKHSSGGLCALLTDISFEDVDSAVWESIELDCNTGQILDAEFSKFREEKSPKQAPAVSSSGSRDGRPGH